MNEIMFIKTSSLGDVIHYMPAITDVRRHLPHARLSWVIEEDYASLAGLHPGVDVVVPVAIRRWRRQFLRLPTWLEIGQFLRNVRSIRYDIVIDAQGLARSAIIARATRGRRHGYDRSSAREAVAAGLYDVRHPVSRALHAVERNRQLTALSLGYQAVGEPEYGLPRDKAVLAAPPYAVLLHGSAQVRKEWSEREWVVVAKELQAQGLRICVPSGNPAERERSERIAKAVPDTEVLHREPLHQVAQLLRGATLVVGLDTGLLHLAVAFGVPVVAIFVGSDPARTGPRGAGPITVLGNRGQAPDGGAVVAAIRRTIALALRR